MCEKRRIVRLGLRRFVVRAGITGCPDKDGEAPGGSERLSQGRVDSLTRRRRLVKVTWVYLLWWRLDDAWPEPPSLWTGTTMIGAGRRHVLLVGSSAVQGTQGKARTGPPAIPLRFR